MDTTPKYIKMCEKAWPNISKSWEEDFSSLIQTVWMINVYSDNGRRKTPALMIDYDSWDYDRRLFPVFRQDQLQEMIEKIRDRNHFIFRFYQFLQNKYLKITQQNAFVVLMNIFDDGCSMEQLWLAFVMHEKYGKVWDNEKEEWKPPRQP